jgi:hypothetical protein
LTQVSNSPNRPLALSPCIPDFELTSIFPGSTNSIDGEKNKRFDVVAASGVRLGHVDGISGFQGSNFYGVLRCVGVGTKSGTGFMYGTMHSAISRSGVAIGMA